PVVGVMADGAGHAEVGVRGGGITLEVIGGHTPGPKGRAALVAAGAALPTVRDELSVLGVVERPGVPRGAPLVHDRMVRPAVALGAGALDGGGIVVDVPGRDIGREHSHPSQRRLVRVRHFDVVYPRPVATLALDVVIGGILDHVPAGRAGNLVA